MRRRDVMLFFVNPAGPYIIWRNPAMPRGKRRAEYRDKVPEGRKYEVLEQGCHGNWVRVTVLTVVDGRPKIVAA